MFLYSIARKSILIVAGLLVACASAEIAGAARGRPHIDTSLGYNMLLSDNNSLLRGVSLSFDGGDPYGSLTKTMPTQEQLNSLARDYGLNTVHLYLEGNSSMNPNSVGYNAADADLLVQRTAAADLYLIITIGNNGENGSIHSMDFAQDFWEFYGPRYKDETHVIYEAHNEPALFTPNQWTDTDWDRQITLYNTIRSEAPDTFALLGSFMGFAGDPRYGANYLAAGGVDWSNAGFAHHGYESKAGIENAISLMQANTSYPATLSTEFWPGDTPSPTSGGQEYNSMYESYHNGWMQFQWLGADDEDLHDFRSKITSAGTTWTPDHPAATWPALGTPDIPALGTTVGIYSRDNQSFLSANPSAGSVLKADVTNYTGTQNDAFTIEPIDDRFLRLKAANGLYVSTSSEGDALAAQTSNPGAAEKFEWLRHPNGDISLRAFGGGGHLVEYDSSSGSFFPSGDNGRDSATNFAIVTTLGTTPLPLIGDPFYGTPLTVPGKIEAEDFDLGGSGQSYLDSDSNNIGGKYRPLEEVDIEATSDVGGGYNVGWLGSGEWLEYTIDVTAAVAAEYLLTARVATPNASGAFYVEFAGVNETGTLSVPNTGDWQSWSDVSATVTLEPGIQTMRFYRAGSDEFNLNNFTFTRVGDFDFDGDVDGLDFLAWQQNGATPAGLLEWENNYGGSGAIASATLVPEPTSLALTLMLPLFLSRRRIAPRHRRT